MFSHLNKCKYNIFIIIIPDHWWLVYSTKWTCQSSSNELIKLKCWWKIDEWRALYVNHYTFTLNLLIYLHVYVILSLSSFTIAMLRGLLFQTLCFICHHHHIEISGDHNDIRKKLPESTITTTTNSIS